MLRAGTRALQASLLAAPGVRASAPARVALASPLRFAAPSTGAAAPAGAARSLSSHGGMEHKIVPENAPELPFDFTEENYKRVTAILAKYPSNYKQSAMLPLLDLAQRQNHNFLSLAAMNKVATILGVEPMRVYETASFYTMFHRQPVGKYYIQLCGTTPCMACGAGEIKSTIEKHLGIHDGETTKDGLFTLLEVECLGACVNAPMLQLNDDFYENLSPASTIALLEACKKGAPPPMNKWGSLPMNGQMSCEGPLGKTSLKEELQGPGARMRPDSELQGKVDPASVKKAMYYS